MKKATTAIYSMSIAVLYSFLKFAWHLYLKYSKEFAKLSNDYTVEYGQAQLKAIDDAQAMPDNGQR